MKTFLFIFLALVSIAGARTFTIEWDAPKAVEEGVKEYRIYRLWVPELGPTSRALLATAQPAAKTSIAMNYPNEEVFLMVTAWDGTFESDPSNTLRVGPAPSPPGNLRVIQVTTTINIPLP